MAVSVHCLKHLVSAAAADGDLLAVSTPDNRVALYQRLPGGLQQLCELEGHEATISQLHFSGGNGSGLRRLVSSSHDRNSYVWTQPPQQQEPQQGEAGTSGSTEGTPGSSQKWQPELVITKLRKAGLSVAWAPGTPKFAIGASERAADVCYLDANRSLWAPRLIKKKHASAVMAVAWHPSGALLATTSADGRLRLFNGVVPGVDTQTPLPALEGTRFGDCLLEVALPGGWGLAVAFSPSGNCLAAASQASQLTLLSGISLQDASSLDATSAAASGRLQHLHLPGLPLKILAFLSEDLLAGGGFDCQPVLCTRAADGQWRYARSLKGEVPSSSGSSKAGGGPQPASLSARIKMFEAQAAAASATTGRGRAAAAAAAAGAAGQAVGDGTAGGQGQQEQQGGPHHNCIIAVVPLPPPARAPTSLAFLTVSMEGCIAEWQVDSASL